MGFDYKKWLNPQARDFWSEWTASCSLFDIDPESKSLDALADGPTSIRVMLDEDGDNEAIKYYIRNGVRHYQRKDFIEWAVSKKFPVHEEMLIFAGRLKPKPETESEADHRAESESVKDDAENQVDPTTSERELTRWLRETWIKENKPNGTGFFNALKKYVDKEGSPIVEHYTASKKGAGIRWNTGSATNTMSKKAIQNSVSKFKKEP